MSKDPYVVHSGGGNNERRLEEKTALKSRRIFYLMRTLFVVAILLAVSGLGWLFASVMSIQFLAGVAGLFSIMASCVALFMLLGNIAVALSIYTKAATNHRIAKQEGVWGDGQ